MRTEGAEDSPSQRSLLTNQPLLATGAGHLSVDLSANTPPIFYPLLVSSLGLSYGAVGVLSMVQSITSSLSQPFFGWLVDRAGSRWLAPLSVLCAALSIAVLGFAPSYEALLLVVAVMGLGVGAFHPHGAKVASLIGGRWRTTSLSIYIVMGTAGLALAPLLGARVLVPAGLGSTPLLLIPGVIAVVLLIRASRPIDKMISNYHRHHTEAPAEPVRWLPVGALGLVITIRSWVEYGVISFLPLLYAARGEAPEVAGQTLFLVILMQAGGTALGGWLADRVGRKQTLVASFVLMIPSLHLFLGADPGLSAAVLASLVGVLGGCPQTVTMVAAQEALPGRMAMASGLASSLGMIMGGIGVAFLGVMADRIGLHASMEAMVIAVAVAAVASLAVRGADR